jgi:hypothetical protein
MLQKNGRFFDESAKIKCAQAHSEETRVTEVQTSVKEIELEGRLL